MKIKLALYNKAYQTESETLKKLKALWWDDFSKCENAIKKGIVQALKPLEIQIKVLFSHERIKGEIGFDIWMPDDDGEVMHMLLYFSLERMKNMWFSLSDGDFKMKMDFPFQYVLRDKIKNTDELEKIAYNYCFALTNRVARNGFSKEIKRAVMEISATEKRMSDINFRQ